MLYPLVSWANPCAQDVSRYCADVERGGGRLTRCLAQHRNDLSPACRETLEQHRGARRDSTSESSGTGPAIAGVPPEFSSTYAELDQKLNALEARLPSQRASEPVAF